VTYSVRVAGEAQAPDSWLILERLRAPHEG